MYKTGGEGELIGEVETLKKEGGLVFFESDELLKAHRIDDGRIKYHDTKEEAKTHLLKQAERELEVSKFKVLICKDYLQKIKLL